MWGKKEHNPSTQNLFSMERENHSSTVASVIIKICIKALTPETHLGRLSAQRSRDGTLSIRIFCASWKTVGKGVRRYGSSECREQCRKPTWPRSFSFSKDARLPAGLQHSLAVEAEAQRQARVRVSQHGAGHLPSIKEQAVLWEAPENPKGLLMQTISPLPPHLPFVPALGGIWLVPPLQPTLLKSLVC